jgi:hypothetical protein
MVQIRHQEQVLFAGQHTIDRGKLAGEADGCANRLRFFDNVVSRDLCPSAIGAKEGRQNFNRGRLACTVGAKQGKNRSLRHPQIDAVQDDVASEGFAQSFNSDHDSSS